MNKPRRTVLSGVVTPFPQEAATPDPQLNAPVPASRRSATKLATIQQTVYLPPAVHDQLRELAFAERVKMHDLLMEGLDAVFLKRGLKALAELKK